MLLLGTHTRQGQGISRNVIYLCCEIPDDDALSGEV